jgi:hypothetical protein
MPASSLSLSDNLLKKPFGILFQGVDVGLNPG